MYSKGISWINDCRIPTSSDDIEISKNKRNKSSLGSIQNKWETESLKAIESTFDLTKGRFPANILVSDDMLNDGVIKSSKKTSGITYGLFPNTIVQQKKYEKDYERGFDDKGTNSRYYDIDKWFDKILE